MKEALDDFKFGELQVNRHQHDTVAQKKNTVSLRAGPYTGGVTVKRKVEMRVLGVVFFPTSSLSRVTVFVVNLLFQCSSCDDVWSIVCGLTALNDMSRLVSASRLVTHILTLTDQRTTTALAALSRQGDQLEECWGVAGGSWNEVVPERT